MKTILSSLKNDWPIAVAIVVILYVFMVIDYPPTQDTEPSIEETSGEVINDLEPLEDPIVKPLNPRVEPSDKSEFFYFNFKDADNTARAKLEAF